LSCPTPPRNQFLTQLPGACHNTIRKLVNFYVKANILGHGHPSRRIWSPLQRKVESDRPGWR
jgi:hypothetical protein